MNRQKKNNGTQEADFFRVSAWRQTGENCAKYLSKGKKVAVVGSVSVKPYTDKNGNANASMEVQAVDVEFLSPASQKQEEHKEEPAPQQDEFIPVEMGDDELPF